jgi:peptidoglycan/xylan/chitin deacetylase (PgdA/CDA1 family)
VIASAHLPDFVPPDEYQAATEPGDFDDWNYLKSRGHEIMPHTWAHLNLTKQPMDMAGQLITKCPDYFEEHLNGFNVKKAVFNFAFNASTPELETYALTKVRAIRTGTWSVLGDKKVNPFPGKSGPFRLGCVSYGPRNADAWVEKEVNEFLAGSGGWLVLNLHGLDDEGWGPVSSAYLTKVL